MSTNRRSYKAGLISDPVMNIPCVICILQKKIKNINRINRKLDAKEERSNKKLSKKYEIYFYQKFQILHGKHEFRAC